MSFTATDPGPGVYQVRVKVDGNQVWAQTPNDNGGKCVPTGTTAGVRVFDAFQPCPTETAVHAELHTALLADGTHTVTVEVEDAAGDVSTVYTGTVIAANHPVSPVLITPAVDRGALNGDPASESAILAVATKQPRTFTRAQARSAVTLTGRLTDPAGAPIAGALLQLTQQVVGSPTPSAVASTTTSSTGAWTLKVPKGASRLLRVAYYSHLLDTVPAAALAFHERVKAAVSLTAPRRVRGEQLFAFTGHLAGGYIPSGGESVQMEILYRRALAHDRSAADQRQGPVDLPVRVHSPSRPVLPVSSRHRTQWLLPVPGEQERRSTREGSLGVVRPVLPP